MNFKAGKMLLGGHISTGEE